MFLGFANFYRRFIKGFGKILNLLTSILKTMALFVSVRPAYTRADENQLGTDGGDGVSNSGIDDKMVNLLSPIKKISSGTSFFTPKAS